MIDILLFVEDDGAANLLRGLSRELAQRQGTVRVLAVHAAQKKLQQLGEEHSTLAAGATAAQVLAQWQPRLVVVGTTENPDTLGLALVTEARQRGLPTVGLIDALPNAAWRWRGHTADPLAYAPDWLVVADEPTKAAYVALGLPPPRVTVIGHVHVDYIHEVARRLTRRGRAAIRASVLPPAAHAQPVVVFVAEQLGGLGLPQYQQSAEYTLLGRGTSQARGHIVLEEVITALETITPRPYLVLRLHPKNKRADFADYGDRIDYLSRGESALEVVYSGDVIVGSTSTLLFEAALLGRPTVAVLPRVVEGRWLPSIAAGVTPVASTRPQVRDCIAAVLEQRWVAPPSPSDWQPGARGRLADFLQQLVL